MRSFLARKVWGSNFGPVISDTTNGSQLHNQRLTSARDEHISSKRAELPGSNDVEMGPANSLHALA